MVIAVIVCSVVALVGCVVAFMWLIDRESARRHDQEKRKSERDHEERMELFDDEDL